VKSLVLVKFQIRESSYWLHPNLNRKLKQKKADGTRTTDVGGQKEDTHVSTYNTQLTIRDDQGRVFIGERAVFSDFATTTMNEGEDRSKAPSVTSQKPHPIEVFFLAHEHQLALRASGLVAYGTLFIQNLVS